MRLLRIVPDNTKFDFMRFRRISFPISAAMSILAITLYFFHGLNFGIDFKGGLLLVGAVLAGILISSFMNLSVWEYSRYSIRGGDAGGVGFNLAHLARAQQGQAHVAEPLFRAQTGDDLALGIEAHAVLLEILGGIAPAIADEHVDIVLHGLGPVGHQVLVDVVGIQ